MRVSLRPSKSLLASAEGLFSSFAARSFLFAVGLFLGGFLASSVRAAEVGMVAAFAASSCPENWSPYSSALNRVLVGAGDVYALGATGGADSVTLSAAQMPAHTHSDYYQNTYVGSWMPHPNAAMWDPSIWTYSVGSIGESGASTSTGSAGSGSPFDNRQQFLALLFCIRVAEDVSEPGEGGGASMGFWPELSMSDAMQIGSLVLLGMVLAWGFRFLLERSLK